MDKWENITKLNPSINSTCAVKGKGLKISKELLSFLGN
jgi:hypothetical protein